MNRAKLLKAARALGFSGASLDELKKWAEAEGHDFVDGDGNPIDITKAWNTKSTATVEADDPSDPGDEDKAARAAKAKADAAKIPSKVDRAHAGLTAGNWDSIGARKRYDRLAAQGKTKFSCSDTAEVSVAYLRLAAAGSRDYGQRAADADIYTKAMSTNVNALGGALVPPPEFVAELISLKEMYGAMRKAVPFRQSSDYRVVMPRRTSGLTVYVPGEGNAITASDPGTDNIGIDAKDWYTLVVESNQLMNTSAISTADFIAEEIGQAFGLAEDTDFFNGTGTSTYHGYTGIIPAMNAVSSNTSIVSASGNSWSAITETDFLNVMSVLPAYAQANAEWYMSSTFYYAVVMREGMLLGGTTLLNFLDDSGRPRLLGKPVNFVQVMPVATASTTIMALYGQPKLACKAIEVGAKNVATSDQRYFEYNQVAIRAHQAVGFTCHDPGANGTAGPVVALKTT